MISEILFDHGDFGHGDQGGYALLNTGSAERLRTSGEYMFAVSYTGDFCT